jgi:hypothetical protein
MSPDRLMELGVGKFIFSRTSSIFFSWIKLKNHTAGCQTVLNYATKKSKSSYQVPMF